MLLYDAHNLLDGFTLLYFRFIFSRRVRVADTSIKYNILFRHTHVLHTGTRITSNPI